MSTSQNDSFAFTDVIDRFLTSPTVDVDLLFTELGANTQNEEATAAVAEAFRIMHGMNNSPVPMTTAEIATAREEAQTRFFTYGANVIGHRQNEYVKNQMLRGSASEANVRAFEQRKARVKAWIRKKEPVSMDAIDVEFQQMEDHMGNSGFDMAEEERKIVKLHAVIHKVARESRIDEMTQRFRAAPSIDIDEAFEARRTQVSRVEEGELREARARAHVARAIETVESLHACQTAMTAEDIARASHDAKQRFAEYGPQVIGVVETERMIKQTLPRARRTANAASFAHRIASLNHMPALPPRVDMAFIQKEYARAKANMENCGDYTSKDMASLHKAFSDAQRAVMEACKESLRTVDGVCSVETLVAKAARVEEHQAARPYEEPRMDVAQAFKEACLRCCRKSIKRLATADWMNGMTDEGMEAEETRIRDLHEAATKGGVNTTGIKNIDETIAKAHKGAVAHFKNKSAKEEKAPESAGGNEPIDIASKKKETPRDVVAWRQGFAARAMERAYGTPTQNLARA